MAHWINQHGKTFAPCCHGTYQHEIRMLRRGRRWRRTRRHDGCTRDDRRRWAPRRREQRSVARCCECVQWNCPQRIGADSCQLRGLGYVRRRHGLTGDIEPRTIDTGIGCITGVRRPGSEGEIYARRLDDGAPFGLFAGDFGGVGFRRARQSRCRRRRAASGYRRRPAHY